MERGGRLACSHSFSGFISSYTHSCQMFKNYSLKKGEEGDGKMERGGD